ncbi:HNH endonuclease [Amphritea sp.]|uniref:HNH endonuclease n=1 Tax=Amphritea sp. TaxID=1872502 RepID=UPI003A905B60
MDILDVEFFLLEGKQVFSPQERKGVEHIISKLTSSFPGFDTYAGVLRGAVRVVIFGKNGQKGSRKPAFAIYKPNKNTACYFGIRFDDKKLQQKVKQKLYHEYNKKFSLEEVAGCAEEFNSYLESLSSIEELRDRMNGNSENEIPRIPRIIEDVPPVDEDDVIGIIKKRRGQSKFRKLLLDIFEKKCAVTGCNVVDLLEAAHIVPHNISVNYKSYNGLLLRADIHTLFDLDLLKIKSDGEIEIKDELLKDSYYKELQGKGIRFPKLQGKAIDEFRIALSKRYEKITQ